MYDVNENSRASDSLNVGMVMNERVVERFEAPPLIYDVSCCGPTEQDRNDYLQLLHMAEIASAAGKSAEAFDLRADAAALVKEKWHETVHNLVMIAGKTDMINKYFLGSAYTAAWYMILVGSGTIANTDTLASHPGWTETTAYAGNRPAIAWGTTSAGSNTATTVTITLNGAATIAGAGICTVSSGTSGTLYSASDFASPRTGGTGDILNITPTVSVA
jgi:hypothetical protein